MIERDERLKERLEDLRRLRIQLEHAIAACNQGYSFLIGFVSALANGDDRRFLKEHGGELDGARVQMRAVWPGIAAATGATVDFYWDFPMKSYESYPENDFVHSYRHGLPRDAEAGWVRREVIGPLERRRDSWLAWLNEVLSPVSDQIGAAPPSQSGGACRIEVDTEGRVALDGVWTQRVRPDACIYLDALVNAGKGVFVTSTELAEQLGQEEFKVTRAKDALPGEITALIESKRGSGSRLLSDAWG